MPQVPAILKSRCSETKKTIERPSTTVKVTVNSKICALLLPKEYASVRINKSAEESVIINQGEIYYEF